VHVFTAVVTANRLKVEPASAAVVIVLVQSQASIPITINAATAANRAKLLRVCLP
jgi:hypothetical protein